MYGLADSPRTVTRAFFGSRASARPSARFSRIVGTRSITPVPPGSALSPGPSLRMMTAEAPCLAARLDCSATGTPSVRVTRASAPRSLRPARSAGVAWPTSTTRRREVPSTTGKSLAKSANHTRSTYSGCNLRTNGADSSMSGASSRIRARVWNVPSVTCSVGCR